jgi:hypothetical protein
MAHSTRLTDNLAPSTLRSLRYWGSLVDDLGNDPDAHLSAAYDGLVTALDAGLLAYQAATDSYYVTAAGMRALTAAESIDQLRWPKGEG